MDVSKKTSHPNPRTKANLLSKIFVWWITDLFWTGWRRDLEQGDLYDVLKENASSRLGDLLENYWKQELEIFKEKGKEPSLLRALCKAFASQYVFSGFLTLLSSMVFRVIQPLLLQKVIEFFTPQNTMTQKEALLYGAALIINGVVQALCMHHSMLTANILGMRLRIACCSMVYRKVMKLSKTSSEKIATGYLVNLMSNDVSRFDIVTLYLHYLWVGPMQVLLIMYCLWLYVDVSAFVGVAFTLLQTIPVQSKQQQLLVQNKSTIFPSCIMAQLLALLICQCLMSKCLAELRVKVAERTDERVRLMNEIVSGIQVIKMYAWEKPFAILVAMVRKYEMSAVKKASYLRGVNLSFMVFTERLSLFCTVLSYYLFGNIITSDKVFSMAQFFNVLNSIFAIFIPNALTTGAEAKVSVHRIQEFLMQEELPLPENIIKTERTNDRHSPVGVTIRNGRAKWVSSQAEDTLHNIFLHVKPGTLCAIIGPVGSGKSSLLHVILRELPLETGFLETDDISYASQDPWLFVGSVRQNILFGEPYDKRKYDEVVRVCALQRDLELFPYGDKTIVGERGVSLSGGQRARINLARAVYRTADLYLLDDPLSAVDTHVGKHLFDFCIRSHLAKKTRILVTHQLQYLKDADMIVILNDGRIENQGTYSDILNSGLDFAKLLPANNVKYDEPEVKPVSGSPSCIRQSSLKKRHSSTKRKRRSTKRRHSSVNSRRPSTASTASSHISINGGFEPEVVEETTTSGAIKWATYVSYLRAGGNGVLLFAVAFIIIVSQVSTSAVDYWSSIWTTIEEERLYFYYENNSTSTKAAMEYVSDYVGLTSEGTTMIYGILIALCVIIVLLRSAVLFFFCMRASVNLHNTMFENILRAKMRFFDTNPSGRILNRFSKDIGAIDEMLPRLLVEVIQFPL